MPRTQGERSRNTIDRLISACVECLQEVGYRQTTLARVCAKAGVSSGAMIHHFPNKLELFAATFDYVFQSMVDRYSAVGYSKTTLKDRWDAILGCFWHDDELEPYVAADIELSLASRVDPILSARFEINSAERLDIMSALWKDLFAGAADSHPDVLIELSMFLTRGLWLVRRSPITEPWLESHLAKWREVIEPKLGVE